MFLYQSPKQKIYWLILVLISTALLQTSIAAEKSYTIHVNRTWDVLKQPTNKDYRKAFLKAGKALGSWTITLAGVPINGPKLTKLSRTLPQEPFVRVVREKLRRPIDLLDFLYFIDDVLQAGQKGLRGQPVWITPSRARRLGITLHPNDIFYDKPKIYGLKRGQKIHIDQPKPPQSYQPAKDYETLGPRWSARYKNPVSTRAKLTALKKASKSGSDFSKRIKSLILQLKSQGVDVYVGSTVRSRERGYLMWGAYILSREKSAYGVNQTLSKLKSKNIAWNLNVPIRWDHPKGWRATIESARKMADAYNVVYATERGARYSNHYGAGAVDLTALGLPRQLTLKAPNGKEKTFDLSRPEEPRDLSLSTALIHWIETNFKMKKLKYDYPHWSNAK